MSKTGKPFSPTSDFDNNRPVALPDLLAGLMTNASLGGIAAEPEMLMPEIMAPEEEMPPATPVNASMPEFLESLRTLLSSYQDSSHVLAAGVPPEAVQDFAHGTNELLNYLLHEVVGATAEVVEPHEPEAVQDFADTTNELLNYLLSQVAEPQISDDTVYSPEAMADFQAGTQDLLHELLEATDATDEAPRRPSADEVFEEAKPGLLDGLLSPFPIEPEPVIDLVPEPDPVPEPDLLAGLLGELLAKDPVVEEPAAEPPRLAPPVLSPPVLDGALANGVLSGLLANLTGSHDLGEVPSEYIDESDEAEVERLAGPFELLLDVIDSELPPPPAIRGIVQPAVTLENQGERFIAFELAEHSYAFPFSCVLETDHVLRWTHVPGVAPHVRGVINLRGEIIPLVDLRALFGFGAAPGDGRMIVVGDRSGKTTMAFAVDRLLGLASVPAHEISRTGGEGVVNGVATASGRKVGLIDPEYVIAAAHGDQVLPRHTILTQHLEEHQHV